MRRNNRCLPILFLLLIFLIGLGYAYLNSSLAVNGLFNIVLNTWDIHFVNLVVKEGSSEAVSPAAIDVNDNTKVNYSVKLNLPGDYYEFEVDVKNFGTLPGEISVVSLNGLDSSLLQVIQYTIKYKSSGDDLQVGDKLNPGAKKTIVVRLYYNKDITSEELIKDAIVFNLEFDITYIQSDSLEDDDRLYYMMLKGFNDGNADIEKYSGSGSENLSTDIFYYHGNTENNNLFFANKCWKIVRTTETGGIKLLYNGLKSNDNGCDGSNSIIGTGYNSNSKTPGVIGYMYNSAISNKYEYKKKVIRDSYSILEVTKTNSTDNYYYGDSISYSNGTYYLVGNVFNGAWEDVYSNAKNKYVCRNGNNNCSDVYYVADIDPLGAGATSSNQYLLKMSNGQVLDDVNKTMYFSSNINDYELVNPTSVSLSDWLSHYNDYVGKYTCFDIHTSSCNDKYYVEEVSKDKLKYVNINNDYVYGNSFSYSNGVYTLTNTKHFWDWQTNWESLGNHHYTCFNTTGTCSSLNYIFITSITGASYDSLYVELTEGKSIMDALNEMLFDEYVNTNDSLAKSKIDTWYRNNILNTDYEQYLEDTVYCNNRTIGNYGNWSPNNSNTKWGMYYATYVNRMKTADLTCPNERDRFTVSSSIGNGMLTYPIGMLTAPEAFLANDGNQTNSYLKSGNTFFTMSPSTFYYDNQSAIAITSSGVYNESALVWYGYGLRPVISLSPDVEIDSGTGSILDPYILKN